jgi:hypothetical protein
MFEGEEMKREHLGDSYDAVKRMWRELLLRWAPLHAERDFIPADLREDFTRLTNIPMLPPMRPGAYTILNDPDTGIRLPQEKNHQERSSHTTLDAIAQQVRQNTAVQCVITFDQSLYRNLGMDWETQREVKMKRLLCRNDICSFYYRSHAPFLFAARNKTRLDKVRKILLKAGIPESRLQTIRQPCHRKPRGSSSRT